MVYSGDPKAVSASQELARIRARLSQMVFGGPGKEGPEAFRKRISQLKARKAELEAVLMGLSRPYALRKKVPRADSAMVAQALPEKTALLEFARIHYFNFKAKLGESMWLPPHYIAFVLHARKGDKLELIDLGDAGEIDGAIALFKKELSGRGGVYSPKAAETSRRLHDAVFEPLRKGLGEVREVFICPGGNLNLPPFEVLQGPDGRFLIEDYTFDYLAAARDLVLFGQIDAGRQGTLWAGESLLLGDVRVHGGAVIGSLRRLSRGDWVNGGSLVCQGSVRALLRAWDHRGGTIRVKMPMGFGASGAPLGCPLSPRRRRRPAMRSAKGGSVFP